MNRVYKIDPLSYDKKMILNTHPIMQEFYKAMICLPIHVYTCLKITADSPQSDNTILATYTDDTYFNNQWKS